MLALDTASWNVHLFLAMRGTAASPQLLTEIAVILAKWPLYLAFVIAFGTCWRYRDGKAACQIIAAGAIGRGIEALISIFAYQPRPFAAGYGPALVAHAANNSMPSSHVLACLILALVLGFCRRIKSAGTIIVLAIMTAWARVYVGVHWPADMVASLIVAVVAFAAAVGLWFTWTWLYSHRHAAFGKRSPMD